MVSFTPDQIDDENLAYHYRVVVHDSRGTYYQLATGAQGFPAGFWASQRSQTSQVPTASSSQVPGASYFHQLTGITVANKKRLYIALYPSGVVNNEERKYHWALLIGPKAESRDAPGVRYHVKNQPISGWTYEEKSVSDVRATNTLLARIVIAKVQDEQRLIGLLRNLPIINGDPNWRCRTWIGQALAAIAKDGQCVGSSRLDWTAIETFAREYVAQKTAAGRYARAEDMLKPKPTYDLLEQREIVP
ncbi:hypothetical protein DPSP01_014583 [Paraphaeosphaeria sporulosa]